VEILLDTDIGSDVDDAIALAYLLARPDCQLVGITTVSGDVQKRAALADFVCRAAGVSDIPIVAGATLSLTQEDRQPAVAQYDWIGLAAEAASWVKNSAVDFLRATISSRAGELTLLTIGPLTNVAALFAAYPETAGKLRSLVSMAGYFFADTPRTEWNVRVDPVAAAIVFSFPVPVHYVVGLDVTLRCRVERDRAIGLIGSPRFEVVSGLVRRAAELHGSVTLHDPLAAISVFKTDLLQWQRGSVQIDLSGGNEGQSLLERNGEGAMTMVAKDVNVNEVMDEVGSRLG
jgi:purine nucleosidase